MNALLLIIAFIAGFAFRKLGYPPLLGYLFAGFVAHSLNIADLASIQAIADMGITLLLFTIGLKLNLNKLAAPHIWGTTLAHTLIVIPLTTVVIIGAGYLVPDVALSDPRHAWVLAFALSFSSTVFAVKMFEERGEQDSLHATVAIGILIIQDLLAVAYLTATSDKTPSLFALALLLLPLARPLLTRVMATVGHGELLLLSGVALALSGAQLFEAVNLKGGLGALIFGLLLSKTAKSDELYKSLMGFKDLFLIGFFLQIGYYGLPSTPMLLTALVLALLVFLRPMIYFTLLLAFGMRARTALLSGFALFNYSEFGLIVAAIAAQAGILPPQWLTTLALALCFSFFIATPFNTRVHRIYSRHTALLHRFERTRRLPEEKLPELGNARAIILGMGRVGQGAYQRLQEEFDDKLVGVDGNQQQALEVSAQGYHCINDDALDRDFWDRVILKPRELILMSLTKFSENLAAVHMAREAGYTGVIAVACRYPDEQVEIEEAGCIAFYLFEDVGKSFATHVLARIAEPPPETSEPPAAGG